MNAPNENFEGTAVGCENDVSKKADDKLSLEGLNVESLEISDFLDEVMLEDNDLVNKVMAASCTTCECCCSCSG